MLRNLKVVDVNEPVAVNVEATPVVEVLTLNRCQQLNLRRLNLQWLSLQRLSLQWSSSQRFDLLLW